MRAAGAAVLLVAGVAFAADVADEAEFHFRRALAFQRQGRFEEALAEFYASNRLVQNRNVQLNIASTLGRLARYDEAYRAYSEVARQELLPSERASVDAALAFLRPKLALVRVTSTPEGATLYLDRKDLGALGVTPKTLALPPGPQRLIFEKEGHRSAELTAELVVGREVSAAAELGRIVGALLLEGLPEGAEVRSEATQELLRRGPGELLDLAPGRLNLLVTAPGFSALRTAVEVAPDERRAVTLTLVPEPRRVGSLVVRANLERALVKVDGREVGFTPAVIESVDVGRRSVEVSYEGREPVTFGVEVQEGRLHPLDAKLLARRLEVTGGNQRLINLEDAPASMTVVTAEEIRLFGYRTLAEALRSVRGYFVWTDHLYDSVGVRGMGWPENANTRVLVLLNGHPLNDLDRRLGPIGLDLGIDLAQVDRIEVVRGGGMVFGANALLGLVNVVTRRPAEGVHVRGALAGDTFRGAEAQAMATARSSVGEVSLLAATGRRLGEPLFAGQALGADTETSHRVFAFARVRDLTLTAGFVSRAKMVPTGFAPSTAPAPTEDQRAFAALQLDRTFTSGGYLLARVAVDANRFRLGVRDGPGEHTSGQATGLSGEARYEHVFSADSRGLLGAAVRRAFDLPLREGLEATLYGAYERRLRPGVTGHAGVRVDPTRGLGAASTASLAVSFGPFLALVLEPYERGHLKLILGSSRRGPSALEYGLSTAARLAPAALASESHVFVTAEHGHRFSDELQLTASLFTSALDNLIRTEPGRPGLLEYANSKEVQLAGAELELRYAPGDGTLVGIAAMVHARVIDGSTVGLARESWVNSPEQLVSARFAVPLLGNRLAAGTELVFVGDRLAFDGERLPSSLLVNLHLSGQVGRMTYSGGVRNLLDERRPAAVAPDFGRASVPQYGRELRLTVSATY